LTTGEKEGLALVKEMLDRISENTLAELIAFFTMLTIYSSSIDFVDIDYVDWMRISCGNRVPVCLNLVMSKSSGIII
jgi:hypothetical protein